jgi:hypothetical protein
VPSAKRVPTPLEGDLNLDVFLLYDKKVYATNADFLTGLNRTITEDAAFRPGEQFGGYSFLFKKTYFRLWNPSGPWVKPYCDADIMSMQDAENRSEAVCKQNVFSWLWNFFKPVVGCPGIVKTFAGTACKCYFGDFLVGCPAGGFDYLKDCYGESWRTPSAKHTFSSWRC